jgi:hypothetical protein
VAAHDALRRLLVPRGAGTSVLNGIEAALWDLKGKQAVPGLRTPRRRQTRASARLTPPAGLPIIRSRVWPKRPTTTCRWAFAASRSLRALDSPEEGWHTPATPDEAANFEGAKGDFLRRHCGADVALMLDGHMGNSVGKTWTLDIAAAAMRALEPYDLFFLKSRFPTPTRGVTPNCAAKQPCPSPEASV